MIPAWVSQYIGVPFEKFNCWQLVCKVYREQFDINLPNLDSEYVDSLDRKNIKKLYERELYLNWRQKEKPDVGDTIVLTIKNQPWHVGIVVSKNKMLHTELRLESIIERFVGPMWQNNIVGFYCYDPAK
jgi:cell wall-associated NlpC family hydrolase